MSRQKESKDGCVSDVRQIAFDICGSYRQCQIFAIAGVDFSLESYYSCALIFVANNQLNVLRFVLDHLTKLVAMCILQISTKQSDKC